MVVCRRDFGRVLGRAARRKAKGRRRSNRLSAERLEARRLLAADATVGIQGGNQSLIGQNVDFVVTFDNDVNDPPDPLAEVGYSPFVNIIMPATGDFPASPMKNGISVQPNTKAFYNNTALVTKIIEFDASGQATHPFAKDASGQPVIVHGKEGDQLVVVELPFGSYGPTQPAVNINFEGVISADANPAHAYDLEVQGGYRYQLDTAGNPTVDHAEFGPSKTDPIQPQLFRLKKTSSGHEAETATGPNFQHAYTVSMAVANGQTVDDLILKDILPDEVQFVSVQSISGHGSTTQTQLSTPSISTPGGELSYEFDKIIGTGQYTDAQLVFDYYVAQKDANGQDVIPLELGGTKIITNSSSAIGEWTSTNPDIGSQTISSSPTDQNSKHELTARTVALQKHFTNHSSPGAPVKAGDIVEYRLEFQVSDFFALNGFVLTDTLSDGQAIDPSFTPTLTYQEFTHGNHFSNALFEDALGNQVNVITTDNPNGTQDVEFNISEQLKILRNLPDGRILGADIPFTGTGTGPPLPTPGSFGTTGNVIFRAEILDNYRVTPSPNAEVVEGDVMTDTAAITSDLLEYENALMPTGGKGKDGSQKSFSLANSGARKTLYAINGDTSKTDQRVVPTDEVTFRLTYELPFSSIKEYKLVDYLPLPIFQPNSNLTWNGQAPSSTAPLSGQWSFGPTDTFSQLPIDGPKPGPALLDPAANSLTWDFGTFADPQDRSSKTDILFTVTATNKPFGDGLLLTNQGQQSEVNQQGDKITSTPGLAQIVVAEPELTITKGVVSTDNANGEFTQGGVTEPKPQLPLHVLFSKPGQPGLSFTGDITSDGLATTPIDATLSNVAGNDLVKFAIIVENTGSSPNGAFDVRISDTYDPSKFQIPTNSVGLNLQVTDGVGTLLAYTGSDSDLFGATGIELVDSGPTSGSLKKGSELDGTVVNNGQNIAVITYDLEIKPTVVPLDVIPNIGTIQHYASATTGPNFANGLNDDTDVTIQGPAMTKTLVGTSIDDSYNSNTQAVIGEVATFQLDVKIPRGTTPDAVVVDTLPNGLAYKEFVASDYRLDQGIAITGSPIPTVTQDGRTLTFNFGDITNSNTSDDLKGLSLQYKAVVLNVKGNDPGKKLTNKASLDWSSPQTVIPIEVQSDPVTLIKPIITVDKTVSPSTAQAGDIATFTIDVTASGTTAHNVFLEDILPGGIDPIPGSLQHVSGVTPLINTASNGFGFEAKWGKLNPGETSRISFNVIVDANVISGTSITNSADATWTSLGNPAQISSSNPNAYQRTGDITDPGEENDYKTSDGATLSIAQPVITKQLISTSIVNAHNANNQAVIGEQATYEITVEIPQGQTPAAVLEERFKNLQLAYVSSTTPSVNNPTKLTVPGLTDPPTFTGNQKFVRWNFGDIVNTDTDNTTPETITLQVTGLVLNVNNNVNGADVINNARLVWSNGLKTGWKTSKEVKVIEPKLTTTKTVNVAGKGGNPGDPVTYTIVIEQDPSSPTDAFDATLTDSIPLEIDAPSITSVHDTTNQVTAANFSLIGHDLTTVTPFDVEKDPVGRTITVTIAGTLQGSFAPYQQITNTSSIAWTSLDGVPGPILPNPSGSPNNYERTGDPDPVTSPGELNNYRDNHSASFTVNTADLRVSKTVSNPAPNVGDTIDFTVTVTNDGPNTATGIELTDTFPSTNELTYQAHSNVVGTYDSGTGVWAVPDMLPNTSHDLVITAKVEAPSTPGTIPSPQTNVVEITAVAEPDPDLANNKATATETPKYADLEVIKTSTDAEPNDGDTVTYTIKLTNNGRDTATGIELTDVLPSPVDYVANSAIAPAGTTFTPTSTTPGGPVTGGIWSVPSISPTLQAGDELVLTFDVIARAGNLSFNTISITKTDTYDPIQSNNSSKTATHPQDADLAVDKIVDNSTPQVGDNVVFTVTVTNNGPNTAKDVVVNDLLPTNELTYQSHVADAGTYVPGTGVWTVPDMPLNASYDLQITATVEAPSSTNGPGATFTNVATGSTSTTDPNPGNETDSAFVTPLQSDLLVAKAVSDATPNIGDTIQFAIGAVNYGPADATQVVVTDDIPVGLTYVGPAAGASPNPTDGSVNYDSASRTLTWDIGALNAGAAQPGTYPVFVYDVTVDAPSPAGIPPTVKNKARIYGREHDPDSTNNEFEVSVLPQYADLEVGKQVSDTTPNVGDIITYTITVTNKDGDPAENVELTDTLPAGLSIVGTPVVNEGTVSIDPGTGSLIWDIGTVFVGSPVTLSLHAEVLAPATGNPVPQTNDAFITGVDQYDPDTTNNAASVTATPQYADLRVTKMVDDPGPNVGNNIWFTINVENLGANPATNVTIDDLLPSGLSYVSADPAVDYDPGTGIWNVGTVDVGHTKSLLISAAVAVSGSFTNVARVSTTDQFDPDHTNNEGSVTVITREADLVVTKSVDDLTPNVNDFITFTVDVTNNGPDIANNVEITDTFPSGLTFASAIPSQGTYDDSTGIWSVGTIDVGSSNKQTLTILAQVDEPAPDTVPVPQINEAEVTKVDEHDPEPLNNIGVATATPQYTDLLLEKETSNVQPNVGDQFTYTVTLTNKGKVTATDVEVKESFPRNISIIDVIPSSTQTQAYWTPNALQTGGVWSVPSIAPGMAEVLIIQAEATAASLTYNVAEITHNDVWDPNSSNNIAQSPTDPQQADLVVTKTVDNPRPEVDSQVTFTVTVENIGPTDAQNVNVHDPLQTGLSAWGNSPIVPSTGTYDEMTGLWAIGPLTTGNTATLQILANVDPPASGSGLVSPTPNIATATSDTIDPNPGNNTDSSTVIPLQADLVITKKASDERPAIGSFFDYTFEVANLGADTASNVFVQETFPTGVTYVNNSYVVSGGSYDQGTGYWNIGTMDPGDRQSLTITVQVTIGNSGGTIINTAEVNSGTWDPDRTNNIATETVVVPPRGVIVGTDIGCETGPFVRVIDPDDGFDRITPFFAYEPSFRGGVRVYGADVTGDGEPDIITAPGPGRPGEVKVWEIIHGNAYENTDYSFFPFGPSYTGGIEISEGSITATGKTEIVAAQNLGGLVSVFEVNPGAATPINTTPVRQLRPFGSSYLGGVTIDTADIGGVTGGTVTSDIPDGIMELFIGSGFGIPAQVRGYNGTTASPTLFDSFSVMGSGFNRGVSVARLPQSFRTVSGPDMLLVSSGIDGNAQVETYGFNPNAYRVAAFQAYGNARTQVFSAAIDDQSIFTVQGLLGTTDGVQKVQNPDGTIKSTLQQSTACYPPLRVAILRN